ncbi:aspartate transaminase [Cutibacterium acnes JCM 18909]|nr:aspartate transaminase [Cutibacterium acnes JCM 18909]
MIPVELGEHGPDVDEVAKLAADPSVKGMWVVPMYANPNGAIYDERTVRALVSMLTAQISVSGGITPMPCTTSPTLSTLPAGAPVG